MAAERMIVMAGTDERDLTKLAEYEAIGGYDALAEGARDVAERGDRRGHRIGAARPRRRLLPDRPEVVASSRSRIRTRIRTTSSSTRTSRSPAASRTTRSWRAFPHRFIEGCLIAAHAVESKSVFVYIRGEYTGPYEILRAALEELQARPELRGDVTIVLHRGAGAYICGEETALLESLEGKRGQPRTKPPFPAVQGLDASPTVVNNVETMATLPPIIEMGGAEYAKLGVAGLARHAGRLDLRPRRDARELRDRERHEPARADLRPRRRDSRRPRNSRR